MSLFDLEKAPFSGLKLTLVHSRCRFKSFKCSTLTVTAVIFVGTAQSLARELLACVFLYQSCLSLRRVASLQQLLSFPANSGSAVIRSFLPSMFTMHKFYSYSRIGTDENKKCGLCDYYQKG